MTVYGGDTEILVLMERGHRTEQLAHISLFRLWDYTHLSHKGFVSTRGGGIVLALQELIIYLWTLFESAQRQIKTIFTKLQDTTRQGSD